MNLRVLSVCMARLLFLLALVLFVLGPRVWTQQPAPQPAPQDQQSLQRDAVLIVNAKVQRQPTAGPAAAFDASLAPDPDARLAFSDGGRLLHAIGNTRAITYAADAGTATKIINLPLATNVLSVTSDGRMAILAVGDLQNRLVMINTETGDREDIPAAWYGPNNNGDIDAEISGDGRLVGIYNGAEGSAGTGDMPMRVAVYDWHAKTLVAMRTSKLIAAGGGFGGGMTVDGAVEFLNNRVGRKVVDLKTGDLIAWFGWLSVRSPDGAWVVEFPDRDWYESTPKDVLLREGATGLVRGKLDVQIGDDETYISGAPGGAFCGTTGRFVLARGRGVGGAGVYAVPSGMVLEGFPAETWRDPNAGDPPNRVSVACSPTGTRAAILSGTRLTIHDLR